MTNDKQGEDFMVFKFYSKMFFLMVFIIMLLSNGSTAGSMTPKDAPDFALEDLSGNKVTLEQYRGQVVLLDFWATWCPPCLESIPTLIELQEKYGEQGFVVLGVSLDDHIQFNNGYMKKFKDHFRINYTIVKGEMKVALDYYGDEKMAVPTAFVINREGEIVDRHVGYSPGVLEKSIKKLL